jgi:vacuolar protein sorting-associated protein 54
MDTVEVHLINSISSASSGFFAALGSLRELQTEAEESVKRIQSLREDLRRLDEEVAVAGLEVAAKRRRRANLGRLARATRQVQRVVEEVKRTDKLVDDGEFDDAAEGMERVGRLVCGEAEASTKDGTEDELIDLRRLKALQGLDSGLQELQLRIGTGFANRFTTLLMSDLRQHIEKVPSSDTMKRWARQRGIPPTYMETTTAFRKELLAALKGLQRAGHIAPATAAYREAVTREMKSLIRKHLPSSNDDDADSMQSTTTSVRSGKLSQQEKSSILARNLRALDADDAEKLLIGVYTGVGEALRRVGTHTKVVLDLQTSGDAGPPKVGHSRASSLAIIEGKATENGTLSPPGSSGGLAASDELSQALDLSSLLGQAVDTAQTQITRVLKVRNEQTIRLSRERFLRYFSLNRLFADECEAVSGRGGQALKGIINAQISGFIQVLGTQETEKIATLLDSDAWNSRDFSEQDEVLLRRVLGAMGSDPPEWTKGMPPVWGNASPNADAAQMNGQTNGTSTPNGQPAAPTKSTATAKPAYIDDNRYILVPSVIALLPTIDTFLSLTASIPSFTPQISTSLLDVLRTFNSRSCQLILGAGATRSAGLKNITTKHLALASQALSFIVALVPYLRECVRRHLPAGQTSVLAEFDKTKRLYQDHQSGIHDKLVEIMTTRSQAHVKALLAIDFAAAENVDVDGEKASPYMETLTKETLTLHRVLSKHLSEVDVLMIMRQIGEAYQVQWCKAFGEAAAKLPKPEGTVGEGGAQKRLVKDAEVFESRLGKIEGFESVGKAVVEVARRKVEEGVAGGEKKEEGEGKKG